MKNKKRPSNEKQFRKKREKNTAQVIKNIINNDMEKEILICHSLLLMTRSFSLRTIE